MRYEVTFLNGNEELKEKGLKVLKSVEHDLEIMLFPSNVDLKKLIEFTEIDLTNYCLDDLEQLESDINEALEERFSNYALCFDYVSDVKSPYWRYQIAWGGPAYEVRFYHDHSIEFVYLDWFVGVGFDVTKSEVFQELKSRLDDLGLFESAREEALA